MKKIYILKKKTLVIYNIKSTLSYIYQLFKLEIIVLYLY